MTMFLLDTTSWTVMIRESLMNHCPHVNVSFSPYHSHTVHCTYCTLSVKCIFHFIWVHLHIVLLIFLYIKNAYQRTDIAVKWREYCCIVLGLPLEELKAGQLSPPGLLVEVGVHRPVLWVNHVVRTRHPFVSDGEDDSTSGRVWTSHFGCCCVALSVLGSS